MFSGTARRLNSCEYLNTLLYIYFTHTSGLVSRVGGGFVLLLFCGVVGWGWGWGGGAVFWGGVLVGGGGGGGGGGVFGGWSGGGVGGFCGFVVGG